MITKEAIEKRIQELDMEEKIAWAELNRITGIKQDCLYWLEQFDKAEDGKT
jgi:hypothetical protein